MSQLSVAAATAKTPKIFAGFLSAVVACVITIAGSHCHAQWSSDPAVNNAICTAPDHQYRQHLARDQQGNTYISWSDKRSSSYRIYAQKISRDGAIQWPLNGVLVCNAGGVQENSRIVPDGQGGAIITWEDKRNDTGGDIYAQRLNSSGVAQWGSTGLKVCGKPNGQILPQMIGDGNGGAVITWEDGRNSGTSRNDIYAQKVSFSGQLMWAADGIPVCTNANLQKTPQIVRDGGTGFYIAWIDQRDGFNYYIYMQLVDANGVAEWDVNGKSLAALGAAKANLVCVQDGSGGIIAAWEDGTGSTTGGDIKAQRVSSDGQPLWTTSGIYVTRMASSQTVPQLVQDSSGGAFVTFDSPANGDVYIQRISSSGGLPWSSEVRICDSPSDQGEPEICTDGSGGAIVTWEDKRSGSQDIFAQRYDASGTRLWADCGTPISNTTSDQLTPVIVADEDGGAIVSWVDMRSGTSRYDIYASRLAPDGSLPPPSPPQAEPPAAPTSLTITDAETSLNLAWIDNATDETGYKVKRSVNGGTEEDIADLPAGSTSYNDSAINGCSAYSYNIIAYNASGDSDPASGSHDNSTAPTIVLSGSNPVTFRYGSTFYDVGASATDGCGNAIHPTVSGINSVDTNTIGSYTITYTATDTSGKTATATRTVNVVKANQAITFSLPSERTYGDGPVTVNPTSNSGLPVDLAVSGPATLEGSTLTITGAGTVTVTATQPGNNNYNAATAVQRTLVVNKGRANINVIGYIGTYDGNAHTARGTALGIGAAPEDLSHLLNITGSFTEIPGGSSTWTFAGNENYNPASGSVSINIRPPGPISPMLPARP